MSDFGLRVGEIGFSIKEVECVDDDLRTHAVGEYRQPVGFYLANDDFQRCGELCAGRLRDASRFAVAAHRGALVAGPVEGQDRCIDVEDGCRERGFA